MAINFQNMLNCSAASIFNSIHKKGDKKLCTNCRDLSINPSITRLLKKIQENTVQWGRK